MTALFLNPDEWWFYMQAWCREDDANAVQLIVGNNIRRLFWHRMT
jgi:hypothetical protein